VVEAIRGAPILAAASVTTTSNAELLADLDSQGVAGDHPAATFASLNIPAGIGLRSLHTKLIGRSPLCDT